MWFRKHNIEAQWNPVAACKRWQKTAKRGRQAFEKIFPERPPAKDPNGFYDLCLAEIDAVDHFNRQQCFGSMSEFIAEVKRLQSKPTTPSEPPFNAEVYAKCQSQWLEFVVRSTAQEAAITMENRKAALIAVPAFVLLAMGVFLIPRALDGERARELGLLQWQAFVGFLLCFLFFGLLCKLIEDRSGNENAKRPLAAVETQN